MAPAQDRPFDVEADPKSAPVAAEATVGSFHGQGPQYLSAIGKHRRCKEIVVPPRTAGIQACLGAAARPRDLLGRVHLLLLALALLSIAVVFPMILLSRTQPAVLWVLGLAAVPALAAAWLSAYRRQAMGPIADVVTVGALCLVTMGVASHWDGYLYVLLAAAVIFSSGYGSLAHVLFRTSAFTAIQLGDGLAGPTAVTMAAVVAIGFVIVAFLMHGMTSSIARYEATTRRERILAATGLNLVAAPDLPSIAAAAVEGALELCGPARGLRVSMAEVEASGSRPLRFRVLRARGERADELEGAYLDGAVVVPPGQDLADQRLAEVRRDAAEDGAAERKAREDHPTAPALERPVLPGEVLLTRVGAEGGPRGVLAIESGEPIADDLPAAVRALATQVSLAISRVSLLDLVIERQSLERFEALIQASADVISIIAPDRRVKFQSPSIHAVFGYGVDEILNGDLADLVHPDDLERLRVSLQQVTDDPSVPLVCECRVRHADGSWRHTETRISNLLHVPAIGGIVLNTRDVTERHTLEAELRHQAFHDSLTGLANRALFVNRVEHALIRSRRHNTTVAVLYCDVDGFNKLNDSLGYTAGETALMAVAERLRNCVRGEDTVARLGGDEFGILLDRLSSTADATLAMERIMATLRQPITRPGALVELTPHIGIVVSIGGDETAEEMLRDGAVAMHRARVLEGACALYDPEMHADAMRRVEVESELRTALEEGQFVLHYQPTIDLRTGRMTGVEALVRWQHPRRGLVAPAEFIPLAEDCGLIVPLGRWATNEACRQVRNWQREIPTDEPIVLSVNLSARQLRHPNIVRDIADALDDSGLQPSRLVLEITESVLTVDTASTLNRLYQLKSLGVRLAVDDFGTGYSSFGYLRRFPVDILKIDKSFVDGVATEPTSSALVEAMIRIGKALRLETVAEGVERSDQAERLRTLQCDLGQGELFFRPLPAEAITDLLRKRAVKRPSRAHAA
jgi:diguanylate cyclase (GGDEF)-like protein/PAS domain S-box-containing protein